MTSNDLRRRRLRLGWNREQLAVRVGVARDRIDAWEDGAATIECPAALEQILHRYERELDSLRPTG